MALLVVPCPGCQSALKAPDTMAGKKAKCKKCGASFRIPGGASTSESAAEGEMLSAMDLQAPNAEASDFDFSTSTPQPASPVKKPAGLPKHDSKAASTPLPATKAAALKPPARKPKPVEEDPPVVAPLVLSEEADVPTAAPAAAGDPFSFSDTHAPTPPTKTDSRTNLKGPEEPRGRKSSTTLGAKRAYQSSAGKGGIGKLILIVGVFGLVVGGVIGGVMIYLDSKKSPEQVSNEKKDDKEKEKKKEESATSPPEPTPAKTDKKSTETPPSKGNEKVMPKREQGSKRTMAGPAAGGMLKLDQVRTIQFSPPPPKMERVQEPSNTITIVPNLAAKSDSAFALARRVFPPLKAGNDVAVLWQTEAPFQGRGEKLLLGIYSPLSGKPASQIAIDGDATAEAVCDLSVSTEFFVHAHTGDNKITVWDTRKNAKVIDGFNPYADKKDLKIAAVYLTEPPEAMIAVSTTGAVHAFRVPTREPIPGEFLPPKSALKPLVAGKSIAVGPGRQSVVLVVGGTIFGVKVKPTVIGSPIVEVGEVGRSLGLAASGSSKLLYVFETDLDGKRDRAVMDVRTVGSHVVYRWPEKDAGEPISAGWVGDDLAMVGTSRGSCIWFEAEGKDFRPIAHAINRNGKALHVASDGHWSLFPDPADPKKCILVELSKPQSAIVGVLDNVKTPPTVGLDEKGLYK